MKTNVRYIILREVYFQALFRAVHSICTYLWTDRLQFHMQTNPKIILLYLFVPLRDGYPKLFLAFGACNTKITLHFIFNVQ